MTDDINDVRHTSAYAKAEDAIRKDERSRVSPEIEAVARAIYDTWAKNRGVTEPWDEILRLGHSMVDEAREEAIAAIAAMSRHAQTPTGSGEIEFEYCNWEGRKSLRRARPISIRFGKSEWHPTPQWLMRAFDLDKGEEREFAMQDMAFEEGVLAALSDTSTDREGK